MGQISYPLQMVVSPGSYFKDKNLNSALKTQFKYVHLMKILKYAHVSLLIPIEYLQYM